jgi:YHS domain-containing protein
MEETMAKDPVCEMDVKEDQARKLELTSDYDGRLYYFCCGECKQEFDRNPAVYAGPGFDQDRLDDDGAGAYSNN